MKLSRKEQILYIIIITTGITIRWYQLEQRPVHHDESLHAIYGLYYFTNPEGQFYRYDPMLHGPFLYHILPLFYKFFDISKTSARAIGTILGSLWVFIPLLFHRFLSRRMILITTIYIALSPSLIYWSRFLRHDSLFLSLCFLSIITIFISSSSKVKNFLLPIFIALLFCTKENSYLMIVFVLANIIYELIAQKIHPINTPTILKSSIESIKKSPLMLLSGILIACTAYCYFYSGGFRYTEGIWDGLYRKSLSYWLHQHNIERISGPFSFQFFILSWYEGLFTLFAILQVLFLFKQSFKWYRISVISALSVALSLYFFNKLGFIHQDFFIAQFLKLKIPLDFIISLLLLALGVLNTIAHWMQNERHLSIASYWFYACFFTYSFVGEKVPWLSLYPLCFGIIYLALYYSPKLSKLGPKSFGVLLSFFVIFLSYQTLLTNIYRAGDNSEIISQVHTTKKYENMLMEIRNHILVSRQTRNQQIRLLSYKENTWPSFWYFYGMPEYQFYLGNNRLADFDYILTAQFDPHTDQILHRTHYKFSFPLRGWWQPNYEKLNFTNFISYALTHDPWSPTGDQMITLFSKYQLRVNK